MKNQFSGEATLRTIPGEKRKMMLVEELIFYDEYGVPWPVPPKTIVNGANIPRFFQLFTGGPWSGLFKKPSIVHDYYCDKKTRTSKSTHLMFKNGMEVEKVPGWKCRWMFKAVQHFGPDW